MLSSDEREKLAREAYAHAVKEACVYPTAFAWARLLRAAKNLRAAVTEVGALAVDRPNEC